MQHEPLQVELRNQVPRPPHSGEDRLRGEDAAQRLSICLFDPFALGKDTQSREELRLAAGRRGPVDLHDGRALHCEIARETAEPDVHHPHRAGEQRMHGCYRRARQRSWG